MAVRQNPPYVLDSYEYAEVTRRDFRRLIQVEGQVQPDRVYTLTAPAAAVVQEVRARAGEDVTKGTVLVTLDSPSLLQDLDEARSALINARYSLEDARLTTQRDVDDAEAALAEARRVEAEAARKLPQQEKLYELGGISKAELDEARKALDDARRKRQDAQRALELANEKRRLTLDQLEAKLETATRAVRRLEDQVARLTVRAPVAGRILALDLDPGDEVKPGDQLVRVADLSRQHVEAGVSALQASQVGPGQQATVTADGKAYPARVTFVAPEATRQGDASVVMVHLALEQAAPLRPFAPVGVEILTGVLKEQPAVERGPFYTSGDGAFVYVVSADGRRAVRRPVRYGVMDGPYIQVVEGLEAGERIITSSYLGFRDRKEILLSPEGGRSR
ncbi:MAG: efflux RND transporter periplasmic adaptor subunit [Limnochordaceae bacterium]|nr:efflux RND transporter periplasmic adaptor subunit [Limnochordaceae bacterium]